MTLIQVVDAARSILNESLVSSRTFPDDTSSFWTDTELTTYHNIIQQEVQNEVVQVHEDYFLTETDFNLVDGCATYALPSNFIKARRLENRTGSRPREILPVRMNDRYEALSTLVSGTGFPGGYSIRGDSVVLHNTPTLTQNSAIKLFYIKRLSDVSTSTNSSEIPAEFHPTIIWGVVKLALQKQQSDNNFAVAEYDKHIRKIAGSAEDRQTQRPRRVVQNETRDII